MVNEGNYDPERPGALGRLLRSSKNQSGFDLIASDLPGTDLTSLLLGAFQQRSATIHASTIASRYQSDRFVRPGVVDTMKLARIELGCLEAASAHSFEPVTLSPLVPFATHAALGETPQNNVVTTARLTEVAADPTTGLSLEAAARRRELLHRNKRSTGVVSLAAVQRVVRAQRFDGPRSFAHFTLSGLVTAGRDTGNVDFEYEAARNSLQTMVASVRSVTQQPISIQITALTAAAQQACERLVADLSTAAPPAVRASLWPERTHGRGYYCNLAFKLSVETDDETFEVGDGGDVRWTQDLLQNKKERQVIAGLGLDRIALVSTEPQLGG